MNENIADNDWKKEAPHLATIAKRNAFTVPDGYFESAGETILSSVFLDQLKQQAKDDHFEVPEHYFENLTERIETKIKLAELPVSANAFIVPENYFDSLQNRINQKITSEQPRAKVIPLWRKGIFKYASAACFALIASFGVYFYQNSASIPVARTQAADLASEQFLYDIDENTIIEHLENDNRASSTNTSGSDTEVENYILSNFSSTDLTHALNN